MHDMKCTPCDKIYDMFVKPNEVRVCPECQGPLEKVLVMGHANGVISDEIDVWVKHAICNADGSPRRYTSKREMLAEGKRRGWTNHVEHLGSPGSDKSRHTSRWT